MSHSKLSVLCILSVLALASYGQAAPPNLVQNPRFITGPTAEPNSFAASWFYYNTASTTSAVVTRLAPGVRMDSINDPAVKVSTTDRGLWQAIPVVAGATYQVNASWRGNFISDGATTNSGAGCRIYVAFGSSPTGPWSNEQQLSYKKFGYNRVIDSWNVPSSLFYTPTGAQVASTSYDWSASWENASDSPCTNHPIAQDVAIVPDANSYMRLRLNFSTTTLPINSGGQAWVEFDNVSVTACQGALAGDIDGDCDIDVKDLARLAVTWLICGNSSNSALCW